MNDDLISPHWYRVAKLKPKLHSHVDIHRHDYRGLIWYLLEDTTTGRNHRFNPAAYQIIGLLDGDRSVQDIYTLISEQLATRGFNPKVFHEQIPGTAGQPHAAYPDTGFFIIEDAPVELANKTIEFMELNPR